MIASGSSYLVSKPMAIDLYCGLGGWADGLLAEGWDVIGFDIERHDYGTGGYPGQLVLQDILTLHGSQFRNADLIVASPPCQEYSYMAMPWKRAKQIARALRGEDVFPEPYKGSRSIAQLNALFDACFRIQREASAATGCSIPLIIENVKGAQPWIGQAAWSFGSFYLWGDVPALMPDGGAAVNNGIKVPGNDLYYKTGDPCGKLTDPRYPSRCGNNPDGRKVPGMDWSKYGQPGYKAVAFNDEAIRQLGRKVPGMNFHDYQKTGKPGRSFQGAAVDSMKGEHANDFYGSDGGPLPIGSSDCVSSSYDDHKGTGKAAAVLRGVGDSFGWSRTSTLRNNNSKSLARKAASAQIAKIPFPLASHIAKVFKPVEVAA